MFIIILYFQLQTVLSTAIFVFCFSGYIKGHGLKYQNILFPNGMVAGVFGTSMSHNDVGVLNMSNLMHYLEDILCPNHVMAGGLLPIVYGDSIFLNVNHSTIICRYDSVSPLEEQRLMRRLNFCMSGIRQSIEHMYGQMFNLFQLLQTKRQFKILRDGDLAYRLGVVFFFMLNCYTCFNGSPCNSMFNSMPPTLQNFLPLDEELNLFIESDNYIYDFYNIE